MTEIDTLKRGDLAEVRCRVWRDAGQGGEDFVERWIAAEIIACDAGTWPLAKLADGQITEIRPFMSWRFVASHQRAVALAA